MGERKILYTHKEYIHIHKYKQQNRVVKKRKAKEKNEKEPANLLNNIRNTNEKVQIQDIIEVEWEGYYKELQKTAENSGKKHIGGSGGKVNKRINFSSVINVIEKADKWSKVYITSFY